MMMRFASFEASGEAFYGAVAEGGVIALSPDFPQWSTMREVITSGGLDVLIEAAAGRDVTHPEGAFIWTIPIPAPEKIICVGVNFPDRNAEYKDGQEAPPNMSLFVRFPGSFTGHGQPLIRPRVSDKLDYEGEIAVVIGRGGRHITQADAYDHCRADYVQRRHAARLGAARQVQRHPGQELRPLRCNGAVAGAIHGRITQLDDIRLTTHVNGDLRQDDRTSRMLFPIRRQIEYISTFTTLKPGDVIVTGTPTGAGVRLIRRSS